MKFKGGWHGESYRHYLARHGVKTAGLKTRMYGADQLTFTKSVLAQIEKTRAEKDANERQRLQAREQSVAASALPYAERPLTAVEKDRLNEEVIWAKMGEDERAKRMNEVLVGPNGIYADVSELNSLIYTDQITSTGQAENVLQSLNASAQELNAARRYGHMTPNEYSQSGILMEKLNSLRRDLVKKYPDVIHTVPVERVSLNSPDPTGVVKFQERVKKAGEATKSGAANAWEKTKEIGSKAKELEEKGVAWVKEEYPVAKEYAKEKLQEFKDKQIEADFKREDLERQLLGAPAFKDDRSIKAKGNVLEVTPEGVIRKPGDLTFRAFEPYGEPRASAFKNEEGVVFENKFIKIAKPVLPKPGFVAPALVPERQPKPGRVAPAKVPIWEEGWKGGEE